MVIELLTSGTKSKKGKQKRNVVLMCQVFVNI